MSTISGITRVGTSALEVDPDVANEVYFPINHALMRDLLGKTLTHVDVLGLPDVQNKAVKDLVKQSFNSWFADVRDNSMSSYRGCLAPIEVLQGEFGVERKYVWHAEGDHAVSV